MGTLRVHANVSYGTYVINVPVGFEKIIPPIHGPCNVIPEDGIGALRLLCMGPSTELGGSATGAAPAGVQSATFKHDRWMGGVAIDKTLALHSIMFVADVYGLKYRSIGRPTDWTAEFGARHQVTNSLVLDAAVGRLFTGESRSTFLVLGTTFSRAMRL